MNSCIHSPSRFIHDTRHFHSAFVQQRHNPFCRAAKSVRSIRAKQAPVHTPLILLEGHFRATPRIFRRERPFVSEAIVERFPSSRRQGQPRRPLRVLCRFANTVRSRIFGQGQTWGSPARGGPTPTRPRAVPRLRAFARSLSQSRRSHIPGRRLPARVHELRRFSAVELWFAGPADIRAGIALSAPKQL